MGTVPGGFRIGSQGGLKPPHRGPNLCKIPAKSEPEQLVILAANAAARRMPIGIPYTPAGTRNRCGPDNRTVPPLGGLLRASLLRLDKLQTVKVLIIDHHARNARDLSQLLANCGYEGRTAHSGAAALRQVKEFVPDFVLLDLGLPDSNSFELAGLLKQACQPACTVVGIGGQPTSANLKSIDCCLKKPFSFEALENILKRPRGREDSGTQPPAPDPLTEKVFDVLRKSLAPNPTELTAQEAQLLNELVKLPDGRLASLLKRAADGN